MDVVEGVSLVLTSPTIWMGVGVVCLWREQAWRTFTSKAEREAHDWLILGVCVAFIGSVVDNAFWGVAWTLDYIELEPYRTEFFEWGALPNIFFRQIAGIYAAHCHIKSYITRSGNPTFDGIYRSAVVLAVITGFVWVLIATLFNGG